MASTNKTSNYELSQFVGSDKPAWLSDYNGDMSKIDTGIHNAQTTATGADGKADANATNIGSLASLTTTAKTDLVSSINEVNSAAILANNVASNAQTTANTAKTTADNLASKFNFTSITNYKTSETAISTGSITTSISGGTLTIAKNGDGSVCKIYGTCDFSGVSAAGTAEVRLVADSGLRPESDINVVGSSIKFEFVTINNISGIATESRFGTLTIKTDGSIYYSVPVTATGRYVTNKFFACIIIVKDFGDEPEVD